MNQKDRVKFKKMGFTDKQLNNYRHIDYSKLNFKQKRAIYQFIRKQNLKITVWLFIFMFLFSLFIFGYEVFDGILRGDEKFGYVLFIFIVIFISGFICINYLVKDGKQKKAKTDKLKNDDLTIISENKDKIVRVHEIYPLTQQEVVEKILEVDENFLLNDFEIYVKNIFLLIFKAFLTRNYRVLRKFESNKLFIQHKLYITKLIDHKEIQKRSDVRIKGVLLKDFKLENNRQVLTVALTSKVGKNLFDSYTYCEGDVFYILTFVRKKDAKTREKTKLSHGVETFNLYSSNNKVYQDLSLLLRDCGWILVDIRHINVNVK